MSVDSSPKLILLPLSRGHPGSPLLLLRCADVAVVPETGRALAQLWISPVLHRNLAGDSCNGRHRASLRSLQPLTRGELRCGIFPRWFCSHWQRKRPPGPPRRSAQEERVDRVHRAVRERPTNRSFHRARDSKHLGLFFIIFVFHYLFIIYFLLMFFRNSILCWPRGSCSFIFGSILIKIFFSSI
jgi:hypothetical protein